MKHVALEGKSSPALVRFHFYFVKNLEKHAEEAKKGEG